MLFTTDVHPGLLATFVLSTVLVHQVIGWRVVMKVGTEMDISPAKNLENLWLSDVTVNDDRVTYLNTLETYVLRYRPTYKSAYINSWSGINQLKMAMYKDGKEAMFLVFNTTGHSRSSFFNVSNIINSSFTDLSQVQIMSIVGNMNRSFEMLSVDTGHCSDSVGWMAGVSAIGMGSCYFEEPVPYFMFANKTKTVLKNMIVADSFAIFVGDCVDQPCMNGGSCTEQLGDFTCKCASQYYGKTCTIKCPCSYGKCFEVTDNDVTSSGIFINGTFINNSSFTVDEGRVRVACQCSKGYQGVNCTNNINDCASNPCTNGGICVDKLNGFECDCPVGISGPVCEFIGPKEESSMQSGGVVAAAITIPLVLILLGAMIGYGVYIYKNPEGFGRSTTYKQFTIARDFVRRSFRRMSGRKPRPSRRLQDEQGQKDEKTGFDNLGFNEPTGTGSTIPVYRRENSEMYELSANDQSVVTGNAPYDKPNTKKLQSENQGHLYNDKGRETGGPTERPPRQVGRQGRGRQDEPPPAYSQSKYQPQHTGIPTQPRSPNDVTTNAFPIQNLNTHNRNPENESRSVNLYTGGRSPTTEGNRYDRYREERSPTDPHGQSYQRHDVPVREGPRTADPVPYDRYRDDGPPSSYEPNRGQNEYDPRHGRGERDSTPFDWYRPRDNEARIPAIRSTNTAAEKIQSDKYRGDRSPSSPYGQISPGWGGQNPRDRYNDDPPPSYRGVNPADRYNMNASAEDQVVFTSNEHSREVSI